MPCCQKYAPTYCFFGNFSHRVKKVRGLFFAISFPFIELSCCYFIDVFMIPRDPLWEVDRNLFVISETLGEGAFGVVVKANASGLVRGEEQHETVAIKMLKGRFY